MLGAVPIPPAASRARLAYADPSPSAPIIHKAGVIAERSCQAARSMISASLVLRLAAVMLAVSALSVSLTASADPSLSPHPSLVDGLSDRALPTGNPAGASVYTMGIEGMMCESSCASKVTTALSSIDGVSAVNLDFAAKQARVHVKAGHTLTAAFCDRSFNNQGYFVTDFRRVP